MRRIVPCPDINGTGSRFEPLCIRSQKRAPRAPEMGVLRALGFSPVQLSGFVVAEGLLLGLSGGSVGIALSYPLFEGVASRVLSEAINFAPIVVHHRVALSALSLSIALAALASALPAYRAPRLSVTDALARVG